MGHAPPAPAPRSARRFLFQAFGLTAIMLLSLSCYLVVLKWRGPAAALTTQTAWDRRIPFWPSWVWAYLLPYLVGPVVVGLLRPATFQWFVRRGLLLVGITLVIFMLVPTQTVRPPAHDLGEGLTAELYANMVAIDEPPANAAPSLHVSLTCLLAWAVARDYRRWAPPAAMGAGVVWLATLLTWQHHLIDVATGAALGTLLACPWPASRRRDISNRKRGPAPGRRS